MSNKTIKITIEHCKNCNLAAHNAVDINTCTGCAIGAIGDLTIFKRTDNLLKQLTIFDLIEEKLKSKVDKYL